MQRRILVPVESPGGGRNGLAGLLGQWAGGLEAELVECRGTAGLTDVVTNEPAPVTTLVVLGPDVAQPLVLARRVAAIRPETRFVFAVDPAREAMFRREAAYAAPPGGRWSMLRADSPELRDRIEAELVAGDQQRRLRTTLDRMKLRIPQPVPVDSGEYRRLVASDRYLASVLRHAHDAIVSIDPSGRVVSWNQGADHLFGVTMEQAQRGRLQDLFRDSVAAGEAINTALSGSFRMAGLEIERGGTGRFVDANFGALRDDAQTVIGAVAIMRDVTERHRAEEELRASSRQKDEFLAMLAHELRNPLAPIRNATQILSRLGQSDPRARRATEVISRQTEHMAALIDDLLDVARVTRGAVVLQRETVSVDEIAADAIEQARGFMEAKEQRFTISEPDGSLMVFGDRKRLTQVLANLLVNAAKYTPERGEITLELRSEGGQSVMEVSDNGMGMDAGLVSRVFDLFVQAERSPDRSEGGLGVGLSLVRSLVAMHGGAVSAQSDGIGKGSTFTVRLPGAVRRPGPEGGGSVPADAASGRPLDLVVVDDNEDAAQTLGVLLRQAGHRVEVQTDPRNAIEQARKQLPDAFILDIGMPHIDGYEFARRVRSMPSKKRPLLIALTGYGHASDKQRAQTAGFDHHLIKPLDPKALLSVLGDATGSAA
jgi:PAS domain S-box-containing protein